MKWDTYDPNYPKLGNELFNYFTKILKEILQTFTHPFL